MWQVGRSMIVMIGRWSVLGGQRNGLVLQEMMRGRCWAEHQTLSGHVHLRVAVSAVPARLGLKAPALARPEAALAF